MNGLHALGFEIYIRVSSILRIFIS